MSHPTTADQWATDAQRAAEAHIEAVWGYFHASEEEGFEAADEEFGEDPSIGPFCGCTTCEVREILHAAVPVVAAAIVAGHVDPLELLLVGPSAAPQADLVGV